MPAGTLVPVCLASATALRRTRKAAGLTQQEFAELAGVCVRTVKRVEAGGAVGLTVRIACTATAAHVFHLGPRGVRS